MFHSLLLVGTGSFIGGIFRFLLSKCVSSQISSAFPVGTFAVNIAGCFLIGIFYGLSEHGLSAGARLFLTVGLCGGFTTFSTFASEGLQLFRSGNVFTAALYAALSVFIGILAVYAGNATTKLL